MYYDSEYDQELEDYYDEEVIQEDKSKTSLCKNSNSNTNNQYVDHSQSHNHESIILDKSTNQV